jgi:hypothetical protein
MIPLRFAICFLIVWLKPFFVLLVLLFEWNGLEWAKAHSYSNLNPIDESNLNCMEWAKAQSYLKSQSL